MQKIMCSSIMLVTVLMVFLVAAGPLTQAKPMMDIYDEIEEDKMFLRMTELLESIGVDDDEHDARQTSADIQALKTSERCVQPVRKGVCRALIPRWNYDPKTQDCQEFKFGGCDGNGNNFPTQKQCLDTCRGQ